MKGLLKRAWSAIEITMLTGAFIICFVVIFVLMFFGQLACLIYFSTHKATDSRKLGLHRIMQRTLRAIMTHLPGVKVTVTNPTGEDFTRPAMIVPNHQSYLDLPCMIMLTPHVIIMAKKWVTRNPLYGLMIHYADYISSSTDRIENMRKIGQMAQKGYSTIIFPEGTRSRTGRLGRFHRGAFEAAQQLGLDIVPVAIKGARDVMPRGSFCLRPGTIDIEILPRIPYDPQAAYAQTCRQAKDIIQQALSNTPSHP
ncbi:MAG: 1-acyl-sn-glycerol-3-phosphate acyltransferase [Muribaculaceae bacterium]|nr:1-acyl-sn-glycerol-3-phosphate acyltransferase [Muribaculaceae bacterium]